jgi:L-aminopeptidase/D-esterase-like protein
MVRRASPGAAALAVALIAGSEAGAVTQKTAPTHRVDGGQRPEGRTPYAPSRGRQGAPSSLPKPGAVAGVDVRGSALARVKPISQSCQSRAAGARHRAVGRSAFGLATADGTITYLEEKRVGFQFGASVVPIVPSGAVQICRSATADSSRSRLRVRAAKATVHRSGRRGTWARSRGDGRQTVAGIAE